MDVFGIKHLGNNGEERTRLFKDEVYLTEVHMMGAVL
jgi:hypothetical protein